MAETEQAGANDNSPISMADWESALSEEKQQTSSAAPASAQDAADDLFGGGSAAKPEPLAAVFSNLGGAGQVGEGGGIDLVLDIPISVSVELGTAKVPVKNMMQLGQGSVIELEGRAGEALTVYANDQPIGKGEVVIVNDRFGIRLTQLFNPPRGKTGG